MVNKEEKSGQISHELVNSINIIDYSDKPIMYYKSNVDTETEDLEQLLFMNGLKYKDFLKVYLSAIKDYIFENLTKKDSSAILILENWVSML